MFKALDLSSNGRLVSMGSNPTPGILCGFNSKGTKTIKNKLKYAFSD